MTSPMFSDPSGSAQAVAEEPPRDLGFGSEVASHTQKRLLNRDGTFNVVRYGLSPLTALSFYHWSLSVSWPVFLAFLSASYLVINAIFAFAYMACGPAALAGIAAESVGGEFLRAFFFSVETFTTIGYGNILPVGVPANVLVTLEALLNIVWHCSGNRRCFRTILPAYSENSLQPARSRCPLPWRIRFRIPDCECTNEPDYRARSKGQPEQARAFGCRTGQKISRPETGKEQGRFLSAQLDAGARHRCVESAFRMVKRGSRGCRCRVSHTADRNRRGVFTDCTFALFLQGG